MRLRLALTIRLDRDHEQPAEQPDVVAGIGEHHHAGDTTTGLGFTDPDQSWTKHGTTRESSDE